MNYTPLIYDDIENLKWLIQENCTHKGPTLFMAKLLLSLQGYKEKEVKTFFLVKTGDMIEDLISEHLNRCTSENPLECKEHLVYQRCKLHVLNELELINPNFKVKNVLIETLETKDELLSELKKYPKTRELLLSAFTQLKLGVLDRNVSDELRLCLETFLREFFNNNQRLEKQINTIGEYLAQKKVPKEISNLFQKLIDYYTKYQNENVKHDLVNTKDEVELMFNLTTTFIKYLSSR